MNQISLPFHPNPIYYTIAIVVYGQSSNRDLEYSAVRLQYYFVSAKYPKFWTPYSFVLR